MSLDNIISVTIDRNTTTPSRTGFGTPLVAAYLPLSLSPERVMSYSSLGEMVTAGFKTTDPAYLAASACFAQNPSPGTVKVGRRDLAPQQVLTLTPNTPVAGETHLVYITGYDDSAFGSRVEINEALGYLVGGGDTKETIVDAFVAQGPLATGDVALSKSGVGANAKLVITVKNTTMDGLLYTAHYNHGYVDDTTADPGIATDLAAINLYDPDWYGLVLDSNSSAEIVAAAAWAQTNEKLFVAQTQDGLVASTTNAADSTSVAALLEDNSYERTMLFFHRAPLVAPKAVRQYPAAAMLGRALPTIPGSITWAYKTLAGVTAQSLNTTELTHLLGNIDTPGGKNVNAYISQSGIAHTRFGTMMTGEYADVIRGADWLKARIQEDVFAALVQEDKLPLTDAGINVIKGLILGRLWEGVSNGFLAPDPEPNVTVPRAVDIPSADKAARKLTGVTFRAYLAGAIHYTVIEGELNL